MRIPVSGPRNSHAWVLIDDEDFPRLPSYLRLDRKGRPNAMVYQGKINGRSRFKETAIARLILGVYGDDSIEVDHINRDPLDNRRANLRLVLPGGHGRNAQNRRSHKGSMSQYRGVSWDRTKGKWIARVYVHGRNVNLGRFDDEDEAGRVAKEYRLRHMAFATD